MYSVSYTAIILINEVCGERVASYLNVGYETNGLVREKETCELLENEVAIGFDRIRDYVTLIKGGNYSTVGCASLSFNVPREIIILP